jgi:alpha-methylacyl-CoA racemase
MSGPLEGIRIVEIAGVGPGPFCAMVLADLGADVLRIDRPASTPYATPELPESAPGAETLNRGRRSAAIDLKHAEGVAAILRLVDRADVLLEGFRPGVMERLGLGPEVCRSRNSRLVYGRITGWGQSGPLARSAGHDINYIALAGCLAHIGRSGERPVLPLNLVGDFGGGGMLLAVGVLAALVERSRSGRGQVVDAAMVDGAALLMTMFHGFRTSGRWTDERGVNVLDGGAHFYDTYACADGEFVAVGAVEPPFYAELLARLGLADADLPKQLDRSAWEAMRERLAAIFRTRTRAEWCDLLEGSDACFAPVLDIASAYEHPHNVERRTFVEVAGVRQPAPAPRFDRTPGRIRRPPPSPGQDTDEALRDWGFARAEIDRLRDVGAVD